MKLKDSVHGRNKFICNTCDTTFSKKGYLRTHRESVHRGNIFTCMRCDKPNVLVKLVTIFNLEESLWRRNEFVLSIEDREKRGKSRKLSISVVFKLHATNSNVNYVGTEHWMLNMWKSIFVWLFRINHSKEIMPSQDVHLSRWFDLIWFCVF